MKCPILEASVNTNFGYLNGDEGKCLKEDCAWWDKDHEQCVALLISTGLWVISNKLSRIKDKMPHEGQFRK